MSFVLFKCLCCWCVSGRVSLLLWLIVVALHHTSIHGRGVTVRCPNFYDH